MFHALLKMDAVLGPEGMDMLSFWEPLATLMVFRREGVVASHMGTGLPKMPCVQQTMSHSRSRYFSLPTKHSFHIAGVLVQRELLQRDPAISWHHIQAIMECLEVALDHLEGLADME